MRLLQRLGRFIGIRVMPYAIPILICTLVGAAGVFIVRVLLQPDDALVIEVVPVEGDDLVQVQVAGAVPDPGVYSLPPGSTVAQALQAAGGTPENAAQTDLESTARVVDGQFILVEPSAATNDIAPDPIDINTAAANDLEALPGIGPVIAGRIVEYREALGGFSSVDQLSDVAGISTRMVDDLRQFVTTE